VCVYVRVRVWCVFVCICMCRGEGRKSERAKEGMRSDNREKEFNDSEGE
jgi:hypothetical protein